MNQKIILVNLPPVQSYNYKNIGAIYPATGILVIGIILKSRGVKVQIIDSAVMKDYIRKVLESIDNETTMVGFSVMTSQVLMDPNGEDYEQGESKKKA